MSNAFKSRFDALAGPRFQSAGIADVGVFKRGFAAAIPMAQVYVDDGVQVFGQTDSGVPQLVTTIRLFKRFGILKPARGDVIVVDPDGTPETFKVESISDEDSSSYLVIVVRES